LGDVDRDLVAALEELDRLLRACGETDRAGWVAARRGEILNGHPLAAARALRNELAGGMGSILDLALVPPAGSGLTPAAAHDHLWSLAERIDELLPER
jgi:hypothetical protein